MRPISNWCIYKDNYMRGIPFPHLIQEISDVFFCPIFQVLKQKFTFLIVCEIASPSQTGLPLEGGRGGGADGGFLAPSLHRGGRQYCGVYHWSICRSRPGRHATVLTEWLSCQSQLPPLMRNNWCWIAVRLIHLDAGAPLSFSEWLQGVWPSPGGWYMLI